MTEPLILYTVTDRIARLTINRPDRLNALNAQVISQLTQYLRQAEADSEVGVVVLTGAGEKAFCAGADIDDFYSRPEMEQYEFREDLGNLFETFYDLKKPVIGRVNGYALGGGFGIALACDIVIASDKAQLGTPEVNLGLFPMVIMPVLFRNIHRKKLLEFMLMGDKLTAQEAEAIGMINHVVPDDELDNKVNELAYKIATKSPVTLHLGRQAFYRMCEMEYGQALSYLKGMLAINLRTEDAREGLQAFFGKAQT